MEVWRFVFHSSLKNHLKLIQSIGMTNSQKFSQDDHVAFHTTPNGLLTHILRQNQNYLNEKRTREYHERVMHTENPRQRREI